MKIVNIDEFEQDCLKKLVSDRIKFVNEILKYSELGLYDFAENEYRKTLEKLFELEKKLS